MMDFTFFDWTYLGTFAGCLAAVMLITQLIKDVPGINKIPTQYVSWALAFVILIGAQAVAGALDIQSAALTLMNAGAVSLAANGGYEALNRITSGKQDT